MKSNDTVISYASSPHIHIIGSNQCVIDGLKGILEYSSERIGLNLGKYSVLISGENMHIDSFSHEGAIIEGAIHAMELSSFD